MPLWNCISLQTSSSCCKWAQINCISGCCLHYRWVVMRRAGYLRETVRYRYSLFFVSLYRRTTYYLIRPEAILVIACPRERARWVQTIKMRRNNARQSHLNFSIPFQLFDCRNHIRVVQSMDNGNRLYICGTNAHNPKDYVIYVSSLSSQGFHSSSRGSFADDGESWKLFGLKGFLRIKTFVLQVKAFWGRNFWS